MYCSRCGALNPDESSSCAKCGSNLKPDNQISSTSPNKKKGLFEQMDIISEEIEKLGFFYKLIFYIEGFFVLLFFSIYTLFIGPIIVYFWGKRGWPRNSLVKAFLYSNLIYAIILILFIPLMLFSFLAFDGTEQAQFEVGEAIRSKEKVAGNIISINGSLVNDTDQWDDPSHTLKFKMTDGLYTIDVVYTGEKPDMRCKDTQIRATGQFEGNVFKAHDMWVLLSSKYYTTSNDKSSNQTLPLLVD